MGGNIDCSIEKNGETTLDLLITRGFKNEWFKTQWNLVSCLRFDPLFFQWAWLLTIWSFDGYLAHDYLPQLKQQKWTNKQKSLHDTVKSDSTTELDNFRGSSKAKSKCL